jgi:hypothetical protein
MNSTLTKVTLPEGASLQKVGQILLDAWEVGSHQWQHSPLQLKDGPARPVPPPLPHDAMDFFRLLQQSHTDYLLVGGIAMLTYVEGRNTRDLDLLTSLSSIETLPEFEVLHREGFFVCGRFKTLQVNLLLNTNALFKIVQERFASTHRFAELEVPAANVEGLLLLKLYAIPSLCRQFDWDRVYIYESDVKQLLARYEPDTNRLLTILAAHVPASDLRELRKLIEDQASRRKRIGGPDDSSS